jgi:hypothetical protein
MPRSVHGGRGMLNLPGHQTTAAIVAECEDTSSWPVGKGRNGVELDRYSISPHITVQITDCSEKVTLEFDVSTANELDNSLHKIDVITEALAALRRGLIVEHHRYVDRAAEVSPERQRGMAAPTRSEIGR